MKKISLVAACLAGFLSLNASAFDMHLNQEVNRVRILIDSNLENKESWILDKRSDFQEKALALQTYVLYGDNPNIHLAEELMLNVLKENGLQAGPWKERDSGIDSTVMANDDLISLQRVMYGDVNFKEMAVKYTIQKDPSVETREITGNSLSRTLMREGKPPAGPDGAPVRICRLFNVPTATFYELSELQSISFVNNSESNMTLDEACITYAPILDVYWKNRLPEFISNQGVELR